MDAVVAVDQGFGVDLTVPWPALFFGQYWIIIPIPNPPPPAAPAEPPAATSLGGGISGPPVAIMNDDGRIEVFGIGADQALYHIWQTSPGGGWSGWAGLGGHI